MRKQLNLLISGLILVIILLLTACTTSETIKTVEKKIYITVYPPDDLIVNCDSDQPPFGIEEYLTLSDEKREELTFKYVSSLLASNIICNKRIDGIRNWKAARQKADTQE